MLKVRIDLKSGNYTDCTFDDYDESQFREWCNKTLVDDKGNKYDLIIYDNCCINTNEIERIYKLN